MKDYLKKRKKFIQDFNNILPKYKNELPHLIINEINENIYENSCFTSKQYSTNQQKHTIKYKKSFPKTVINCKKIKMLLNKEQKIIIDSWMDAYTRMYNETLVYIRENCPVFKNNINREKVLTIDKTKYANSIFLRSELMNIKKEIQKNTQIKELDYDTKIHTHTLDYAIRQLVSNIKSAITNTVRGNFKRFRIKFWKNSRPSKTIEIEKQYIKNDIICPKILKTIKYEFNDKPYNLSGINNNVKINYNKINNEYMLLIPNENKPQKVNNRNKIISLDPGLRTFMTGLSDKKIIKLGTDVNSKISRKLDKLDKIKNNKNISNKIKKKNETLINRKIHNMVDEVHWKCINYLTKNYDTVFLGDMSAKSIVNNKNSILSASMKVACLRSRYFEFRQRLEYKCNLNKVNYFLVNECYTSKICSLCGHYNDKLKGEKIYECPQCKISIDRDVNGCRNIFIKSQIE